MKFSDWKLNSLFRGRCGSVALVVTGRRDIGARLCDSLSKKSHKVLWFGREGNLVAYGIVFVSSASPRTRESSVTEPGSAL